jgi:hypothetical protein
VTDPQRLIQEASEFERQLLLAARRDALPNERRSAILGVLGVVVPWPFAVNDPSPAAATLGKGLFAKLSAGVLAAMGVAAGVHFYQPSSGTQVTAPAAVPVAQSEAPARPAVEPKQELGSTKPESLPLATPERDETKAEAPTGRASGEQRSNARQTDSIARELEQVEAARAALRAGSPSRSLHLLNEYAQRFPRGSLRTEATVLRIEALSASGDTAAASRLGNKFLAQSPNGPYARRIRSLLAQSGNAQH